MICYGFKCGTGTSSRKVEARFGGYTVGVLVQANHGARDQLRVAGVPVGKEIPRPASARADDPALRVDALGELGSIIIVVATDAPLLPHQLKRLARRAALGLARTGSVSGNGSGDIFIAFSTANADAASAPDDGAGVDAVQRRGSARSSKRRCRRPKKRSSTRSWRPRR